MTKEYNEWIIRNKNNLSELDRATKTLLRLKDYGNGYSANVGTQLLVQETVNRDYSYSLSIFFKVTPFPIKNITLPIECNKGDIESACNIADEIYRSYCTEMVKYFTEDCKLLPEI